MASPVAVIPNPLRDDSHVLFTLNDKKQLAMEFRIPADPDRYERYADFGTLDGPIVNPAQISVVMRSGMVCVTLCLSNGRQKNIITHLRDTIGYSIWHCEFWSQEGGSCLYDKPHH